MSGLDERWLPAGWHWVRLEDIATVISKGTTPTTHGFSYSKEGVAFLRAEDVNGESVNPTAAQLFISADADSALSRSRLLPGDFLLTIAGTLGRVGYIPEGAPLANCNQAIAFARLKLDLVDPQFLCFSCRLERTISPLIEKQAGGALKNLNLEQVRGLEIPLPPLSEQKRIAAILTERLAAVKRARKASEARLEAARALPAAYLREVFKSEEAKGWPKFRLGAVMTLRRDIVHPKNNPSGDAIFVGLEHIESVTGVRVGHEPVKQEDLTGRKPRFLAGDIVYGYLRPYLNKVWIADFDGLCSVDQYVYSVNSAIALNEYVAWYLRSPVYLEKASIEMSPGQLPRIRIDEVEATEINLPSLERQKCVVSEIRQKIGTSLRAKSDIEAELDAISCMNPALLRQAFSGTL